MKIFALFAALSSTMMMSADASHSCGIDVCIAVDMSGSVCSPDSAAIGKNCIDCADSCHEADLFNKDVCCSDFHEQLQFAKELADYVAQELPDSRFSLVSFATQAATHTDLTDHATFKDFVDNLDYAGGWTDTGNAIQRCHLSLSNKDPNEKVMVVITDGLPSNGYPKVDPAHIEAHKIWAYQKAMIARDMDITILPVLVNTKVADATFLKSLASDPDTVVSVDNFEDLKDDLTNVVNLNDHPCGEDEPEPNYEPEGCVYSQPTDFCFAIDMSGSVCTPPGISHSCSFCGRVCWEETIFDRDTCCANFHYAKQFTADISADLTSAIPDAKYSLVSFANGVTSHTGLTDRDAFVSEISQLDYEGGYTSTGPAIEACHQLLLHSTNHKVLVLLTDGVPTRGAPGVGSGDMPAHRSYASGKAQAVKDDGITLIPILVETNIQDTEYLMTLASDMSAVATVDHFYRLESELDRIAALAKCY